MSQLKNIKDRIESVQQTCKITQAMKMVAAAKFKSASDLSVKSYDYIDKLTELLNTLISQSEIHSIPYLLDNKNAKKEAVIVISGDRGLCGGFNSNLIKKVNDFKALKKDNVDYFFWGQKAYDFFKNKKINIISCENGLTSKTSLIQIIKLFDSISIDYINGVYASVHLIYTSFKSILASQPILKQILPIKIDPDYELRKEDYYVEPNTDKILNSLSKEVVHLTLFRSIVESFAAEQGARMTAMDSATDNAKEVIRDLKLQYNRGRQAQITTELSEIVAGAEALVQ